MPTFHARELNLTTGEPTGRVELYDAADLDEAHAKLLYTRRLANACACTTALPHKKFRFVHVGDFSWSITKMIPE